MQAHIELIERPPTADWWRGLLAQFAKVGEAVEIRCWNAEQDIVQHALQFGQIQLQESTEFETPIVGTISKEFLESLFSFHPKQTEEDDFIATKFFTLRFGDTMESAHYGREIHLWNITEQDAEHIHHILRWVEPCFSIHIYN